MKEKTLLRVALVASIVGIITLFFISQTAELDEGVISKIDETNLDETIRIAGVVTEVKNFGTVTKIDIAQLEDVPVIVFDNITLFKGDYVEIVGYTEEYEGELEIIAERVVLK